MVTVAPAEVLHGRRDKREASERLLEAQSVLAARTAIQRWTNDPPLACGEQT
jgi:hypothetical protein